MSERFNLQTLEARLFLSASRESDDAYLASAQRASTSGPPINLTIVALHEMGHALGLPHVSDPNSIMYAYYNANYDVNNLSSDPVISQLRSIYSSPNSGPWKDSLDANPSNNVVDITYSFMLDGARMDKGSNTLFQTLNKDFGSTSTWEQIFTDDLNRWASASGGEVAFHLHSDNGASFGASGLAQNDPNFGDIRIGAHRFDGPGKVLAHTYYPPPNGGTAAGDLHIDNAENWVATSNLSVTPTTITSSTGGFGLSDGGPGNSDYGHRHNLVGLLH